MNRLANLFALSSLAVFLVSLSGAPTTALAADSHHVIRNIHRGHGSVAKRRRSTNHTGKKARRCRPRPSVPGGDNTSPAPGSPNVVAPAPSPPSGDYTPPAGDYTPPAGDYTPPVGNSPAPTPGSPTPPGDSPTSSSSADQQAPTQDAPATTSNAPTTAAPTPTGGQASGGSWSGAGFAKGGVAWPMGNNPGITRIKTNKMGWYYTWSPWCVDGADAAGFTCIRMLWGWKQVEEFKAQVPSNGDGKWLLFINEPNQHDQSNTSPESAAQLWRQEFGWRKNQGYRLISAATTSAPDGIQWMRDFFATCPDCRAQTDAIAVHYYDVSIEDFKRYVTSWREFGLPIFVTEYACQNFNGGPQCSMGDIYNFMGETMKWMDQQDWIYGYAYFGWMYDMYNVNYDNRLLGDGDWPTDLGWYSIN